MSERLSRFKEDQDYEKDDKFKKRIHALLGCDDIFIDDVDAQYYDFSVLPENMKDKFYRDAYMLYGIDSKGNFHHHWIDRWGLDGCDEPFDPNLKPPNILQKFNPDLLSAPAINLFGLFGKEDGK